MRAHFWLSILGVLLYAFPLVIAGVIQGLKLADASVPFADAVKAAMMPFRISTLGETLLLIGNVIFCFNVTAGIFAFYRAQFQAAYATATTHLQPTGAKP
jgi:cbb3-type cytochrome oxidase subunit 1